jgi:hypothetical protein
LWKVNIGGSLAGLGYSSTLYDSNRGFAPDYKAQMTVSTTLIGGGFDLDFSDDCSNSSDYNFGLGLGKHLGVRGKINRVGDGFPIEITGISVGPSMGSPLDVSTSFEHASELGDIVSEYVNNKTTQNIDKAINYFRD